MALQQGLRPSRRSVWSSQSSQLGSAAQQSRRYASTDIADTIQDQDLESASSSRAGAPAEDITSQYDPVGRARRRKTQLPPSRYQFRPPKYYRGPSHPHQPPPASDPASREFQPGPFSLPRLEQTYQSTFAQDLMTLAYTHFPPGYVAPTKSARLRKWEGESPYYKNRPLRGPRGADVSRLSRKPITFRNVPKSERVTVHSMISAAKDDSAHSHVAGMVMQAITGVRASAFKTKKSVAGFDVRANQYSSLTCELKGEDMHHFLSKVIDVVMPKIKDYRGVKGSTGDSSGNSAFGFTNEEVALFPEVEVNYDSYPPKMIPGCHIMIHTSATNDRDARLSLQQIGVPFYGKSVN